MKHILKELTDLEYDVRDSLTRLLDRIEDISEKFLNEPDTIKRLKEKIEYLEFEQKYMIYDERRDSEYITELVHRNYGEEYTWEYPDNENDDKYEYYMGVGLPHNNGDVGVYKENGERQNA